MRLARVVFLAISLSCAAACAADSDHSGERATSFGLVVAEDDGGAFSIGSTPIGTQPISRFNRRSDGSAKPLATAKRPSAAAAVSTELSTMLPAAAVSITFSFDTVAPFSFKTLRGLGDADRAALTTSRRADVQREFTLLRARVPELAPARLVTGLRPRVSLTTTAEQALRLCAMTGIKECAIKRDEPTLNKSFNGDQIRSGMKLDALIASGLNGSNSGRAGGRIRIGIIENVTGDDSGNYPRTDHVGWKDTPMTASRWISVRNCAAWDGFWYYCTTSGTSPSSVDHGQLVSAIAAASIEEGQDSTITDPVLRRAHSGTSPEAQLYYYGKSAYDSCTVNVALDRAITDGVDVVNMSWGADTLCSATYDDCGLNAALSDALDAGVIPVAAIGNEGALSGCHLSWPGYRPEVIGVGGVTESTLLTHYAFDQAPLHAKSSYGPMNIGVYGSGGSTAAGVGVVGGYTHLDQAWLSPAQYYTGSQAGTSFAAPEVAGAVADFKQAFASVWGSSANDPRIVMTNFLLQGDGWDGLGPPATNRIAGGGIAPRAGFGRPHVHWPSSASMSAPWAWGWRWFTIYSNQEACWPVGGQGVEDPAVKQWKGDLVYFPEDLTQVPDIDYYVWDASPAGCPATMTPSTNRNPVASQTDYDYRLRIRLDQTAIQGKCLWMCARAYTLPSSGQLVYAADYFTADTAGH